MAPFTLRMMVSLFSRNSDRRTRIVSRMPPASPAATMLTYRSPKALGCLRSASARVWPLSTSYTTDLVISARDWFSVCFARMSSACTSGSPALIMVANCRVMTTRSRVLMPPPNLKLSLKALGAARTCTTTMRFFRRWAMTSSRVGRSTSPDWRSPFSVRAVYWKTGIGQLLPAPISGAPRPWPAALPHAALQQGLCDHPFQHESKLGAHLRLLVRREDVDDAVDALHRGVRVQGREGQVPGLGDGERRLDGLEVAHLANQHDVGV